jgi:WD40 repeat protein
MKKSFLYLCTACAVMLFACASVQRSTQQPVVLTLSGHNYQVYSAVYSPDGRRIISVGADETVKVWDAWE